MLTELPFSGAAGISGVISCLRRCRLGKSIVLVARYSWISWTAPALPVFFPELLDVLALPVAYGPGRSGVYTSGAYLADAYSNRASPLSHDIPAFCEQFHILPMPTVVPGRGFALVVSHNVSVFR